MSHLMHCPALAAAALLTAGPASGDPVTMREALNTLSNAGAERAEVAEETTERKVITAALKGYNIVLELNACRDEAGCGYAILFASFELAQSPGERDLERVNRFNSSHPFGRALVFDHETGGRVAVDMAVALQGDTVFATEHVDQFSAALESFVDYWERTE